VRTNDAARFELPEMDVVLAVVRERIARAAGLPVAGLEWTQVLRYAATGARATPACRRRGAKNGCCRSGSGDARRAPDGRRQIGIRMIS
jgi:hypothetical protein